MDKNQIMSMLPKVADLLEQQELKMLCKMKGRNRVTNILRESIEIIRQDLMKNFIDNSASFVIPDSQSLKDRIIELVTEKISLSPFNFKPIINATGVVIHTNLGRSPLPYTILNRVVEKAKGYSNLEYDLKEGVRGERYDHFKKLLCQITGAEDALVVNNNAAAVLLCLSALAFGKEVIVSRGQLVEIGGKFRIPDVMAQSGAQLVEVGTTNKTYIEDYERVINEKTGLLLKAHTSNYKVIGFTSSVDNKELSSLGHKYNIPVMEDLGSGILVDLTPYGFPHEPTVSDSINSGIDLVTFSGDKLLGGPQAGFIVGKKELIKKIKCHPLTRALRIDKMTLAAIETLLTLYKEERWQEIPTLYMLTKSMKAMKRQALMLYDGLLSVIENKGHVEIIDDYSEIGGGSFPDYKIPTKAVAIELKNMSTENLSRKLRRCPVPIIGRIKRDKFIFDVRTMTDEDIAKTIEMVGMLV